MGEVGSCSPPSPGGTRAKCLFEMTRCPDESELHEKSEESARGGWTGTDSLLLAWWLFLELATLNWSPGIY